MGDITEAFGKTCQLLCLKGYEKISVRTEVIKEKINDDFSIVFNCINFNVNVFHKDMPIGVFGPTGGAMMFGGEDDLIKALDTEIKLLTGKD